MTEFCMIKNGLVSEILVISQEEAEALQQQLSYDLILSRPSYANVGNKYHDEHFWSVEVVDGEEVETLLD